MTTRNEKFPMPFIHGSRVARFVLVRDTKTGKIVPNEQKMYQMVITYPKCLENIANMKP
jgi:hypothetical protein